MSWLRAHTGEAAALMTALCWVGTAMTFAAAGRRIGATAVNLLRIFLALAMLASVHRLVYGQWIPAVERESVVYLGISGLIGLAIGDQLLFTAFVDIGPRLSTLLMTLVPPIAAVLAWPILDEPLAPLQIAGIGVAMIGIAWVVLERRPPGAAMSSVRSHRVRGVVFGIGGAACQAIGLILSKLGMGHVPGAEAARVDPWPATLVRMFFAAMSVIVLAGAIRAVRGPRARRITADARRVLLFALAMTLLGAAIGPVIGVWSSMVAVDRAEAGVAATLMAMTPVFILPLAVWVEGEHVSWRAGIGAAVAVLGVAILALAE